MIFTATCGKKLDIHRDDWMRLPNYTPPHSRFPGGTLRMEHMTVLIFRSGKIVITKVKSLPNIAEVSSELGVSFFDLKFSHCAGYLRVGAVDLCMLKHRIPESSLEPEIHPGLIFKVENVSVILYHTGTVMYCGCKSLEQAKYVETKIISLINNKPLFKRKKCL